MRKVEFFNLFYTIALITFLIFDIHSAIEKNVLNIFVYGFIDGVIFLYLIISLIISLIYYIVKK